MRGLDGVVRLSNVEQRVGEIEPKIEVDTIGAEARACG